jgi:hypothetical protein
VRVRARFCDHTEADLLDDETACLPDIHCVAQEAAGHDLSVHPPR